MATPISDTGNVVFIDTNIDTHLALTVSDHDTVSDLKKIILSEHPSCFPKIGQIQIHGIKVKRNGYYYHLSDSMVVRSAFSGFNKAWFLSVDVSALEDSRPSEKLLSHGSLRQLESIGIANNALVGSGGNNNNVVILPCNNQLQLLENKKYASEGVPVVSPCVSEHIAKEDLANLENGVKSSGDNGIRIPLPGSNPKIDDRSDLNNVVRNLDMECEVDGLGKGNKDDYNVAVEESTMSVQSGKRKRKSKRKREDVVGDDNSKEETPLDRLRVSQHTEKDAVKDLEMVPSLNIECEVDGPGDGNKDDRNVCEETPTISVPSAKKRKKSTKKKEATVGGDNSKEEIPSDRLRVSQHTEKDAVKDMEMVPSLNIECEVDGPGEGNKNGRNVCEETPSIFVPSAKKKEATVGGDNPKEETPSDRLRVSQHTEKDAVKDMEMVPSLNIECKVDGPGEGNRDDHNVCEETPSISVPSAKRKKKSTKIKEATVGGDKSKEEIPSDRPCVPEHTEKEAMKHLEVVPSLNIECEVDGPGEGNKNDRNVCEETPSISVPSAKKRKSTKKEEATVGGDNPKEETPSDRLRVSQHTEKDAVKDMEMIPSLNIECKVDGPGEGNKDDHNVCEETPSISVPSAKRKKKSTKKKEATVGGDKSKEEIPSDRPCVSEHTDKEAMKHFEVVPNLHIECEVDGSGGRIEDDHNVCEEVPSISVPSAKRKNKSKKNKKGTVGGDNSKDNIAAVDNPAHCPSERTSSFKDFRVPQSGNKQDEKEIPFDRPCISDNTEKAVKNMEMVPNSHIQCEVDGSNKGTKDDSIVCEEGTSKPAPSAKKKKRSKSKKEDNVGGDISKDNIASVDNPLGCPSERASSLNNFQVSQSENKQDEKEEIPFDYPCVPEHTAKAVTNLEMVPNSHIECEVDGSDNGIKGDSIICGKGTSKPVQSAKKKHKSVRKKDDTVRDDTLKENDASVVVPVQQDILVLANSAENADKEVIKETEVLKEHHNNESNDNNTENGVTAVSMKEASELKSPLKKPKKRKRSLAHNSKESLKGETASEDIFMNKTNLDKMEIGTNACKESIQSTTKETGDYNKQSDIGIEVQPSDVNEPKDLMEDNKNVVAGHCHESEVGQIEGAAEGEVSPQNDDVNGMKEPVKLVKEQKGIKKGKNKGGGQTLRVDNGLVDASESETVVAKSLKVTVCDPMPGNAETQESRLNQTEGEGKVMQQEEIQGTVLSVTEKGGDFSADNADSLEQTQTKSNAENLDEHVSERLKKKPNNKQSSTSKSTSDMPTNGHVFYGKKERDVQRIYKAPNANQTRQVAKLSSPSDSAMSSIVENRKSRDNAFGKSMDLKKQREHIPISNAKFEGSNKMVQNKARKASGNSVMEVVSKSQQKKSLLGGSIFKDDSSSSSEDEDQDKVDYSDASTRTPSDNSLASYLDGYDSPGVDSQQNGSSEGEMLENDEISPLKTGLSGTTKMSIDRIVRSSTRYKNAKITASQLDESIAPLDESIVPESQGLL